MGTQRIGLLNRLCDIINHNEPDSSAYVLAEYFLMHYEEMGKLNIYDVAEECFSSRSGIRRFAQSIGYDNFKEMKEQFPTYQDFQAYHFYPLENQDYQSYLSNSLHRVMDQVCQRVYNSEDTGKLIEYLHDSVCPMFYCCGMSQSIVQEFQREMIFCKKMVQVSSDLEFCRKQMEAAEGNGLLIVISVTGNFADRSLAELDTIDAKKVLIIASNGSRFAGHFDMIYMLPPEENGQERKLCGHSIEVVPGVVTGDPALADCYLYGRYGMTCLFDLLFCIYARRYSQ